MGHPKSTSVSRGQPLLPPPEGSSADEWQSLAADRHGGGSHLCYGDHLLRRRGQGLGAPSGASTRRRRAEEQSSHLIAVEPV